MLIALEDQLPERRSGQTVVGTLSEAVDIIKNLDDCRNYYLLDLSVRGGYAPTKAALRVEEPPVYEPVGRSRGLPGPKAPGDPEDALRREVRNTVIDPPGCHYLPLFHGALGGLYDLWGLLGHGWGCSTRKTEGLGGWRACR